MSNFRMRNPEELRPHPVAELWPRMSDDKFSEFVDAVRSEGGFNKNCPSVTLIGDEIIDGVDRWRVAKTLGIDLPCKEYQGSTRTEDLIAYTTKENWYVKGVTKDTYSTVILPRLDAYQASAEKAKERKREGGRRGGQNKKELRRTAKNSLPSDEGKLFNTPRHDDADVERREAKLDVHPKKTNRIKTAMEEISEITGISRSSLERGARIYREGIPELVDAVGVRNEISLNMGSQIAALPEPSQKYIMSLPKNEMAAEVKRATLERQELKLDSDSNRTERTTRRLCEAVKRAYSMGTDYSSIINSIIKHSERLKELGVSVGGADVQMFKSSLVFVEGSIKKVKECFQAEPASDNRMIENAIEIEQ